MVAESDHSNDVREDLVLSKDKTTEPKATVDRIVNATLTRLRDRPNAGWDSALRDVGVAFSVSAERVRRHVLAKATPQQKAALAKLGAPLAMEEDYQNGQNSRMQSGATGRMQSDVTAAKAPTAPIKPQAPSAPGAPVGQDQQPKLAPQAPKKPISKDQISKAQKLATSIGAQGGVKDAKTLATKVGQQIGSVGGSQGDVSLMTGLVQAQLANQGEEIKEGDEIVNERGFMSAVRGMVGGQKAAKAVPTSSAPQAASAPANSAAPAKAAPVVTRSVPVNWKELLGRPAIRDAIQRIPGTFGFPTSIVGKIDAAMARTGSWSMDLGSSLSSLTAQRCTQAEERLGGRFKVSVSGQGEQRVLTIRLIP